MIWPLALATVTMIALRPSDTSAAFCGVGIALNAPRLEDGVIAVFVVHRAHKMRLVTLGRCDLRDGCRVMRAADQIDLPVGQSSICATDQAARRCEQTRQKSFHVEWTGTKPSVFDQPIESRIYDVEHHDPAAFGEV